MYHSNLYPGAALIATGLALHGYRKGSLSASGAVAAFLVGYGHLATPLKVFGVAMIVFYLLASRVTKVKVDVKAKLEDGIDPTKPQGNRDAVQVFSNSLPSLLAAIAYRIYIKHSAVSLTETQLARSLIFIALGHLSNCLADTLASELGILSKSQPRYILTGRPVPPGTNGGVSVLGLAASLAGGAIMGLTMVLDLLVETSAVRRSGNAWAAELLLFGTLSGLAGSLLDSLLGATLQKTLYSVEDRRILTDRSRRRDGPGIKRIGFGVDVLSNSGVNFVCGFAMAACGWWYAQEQ